MPSFLDNGEAGVEHLVHASSSSVYGTNKKIPYSTDDKVDNPVSLYAATKKSNELMAHAYSKLYNIPSTGLRFFTVYGPAGRPDMAYFGFTNKLLKGQTKLATTSSTGGLSFALQRAIVTARPKGRYRKHFYWPAIKRYYWNLLFSIPLLAHLYISELLHLLYCRLFQHNIL